ncbi:universal stress protein [Desulfosoma caldarium]
MSAMVLGFHGRSNVESALLKSVSDDVIGHSKQSIVAMGRY